MIHHRFLWNYLLAFRDLRFQGQCSAVHSVCTPVRRAHHLHILWEMQVLESVPGSPRSWPFTASLGWHPSLPSGMFLSTRKAANQVRTEHLGTKEAGEARVAGA